MKKPASKNEFFEFSERDEKAAGLRINLFERRALIEPDSEFARLGADRLERIEEAEERRARIQCEECGFPHGRGHAPDCGVEWLPESQRPTRERDGQEAMEEAGIVSLSSI